MKEGKGRDLRRRVSRLWEDSSGGGLAGGAEGEGWEEPQRLSACVSWAGQRVMGI